MLIAYQRFANGQGQSASYDTPGSFNKATGTIEAQFGTLGQVDMTFHREGKRRVHLACADGNLLFATGTFSFTGENGYAAVTADHVPAVAFPRFFSKVLCAGEGRTVGSGPGTELDAWKRSRSSDEIDLYVSKNKPTAKAAFGASLHEAQGDMQIERQAGGIGPASTFTHNRRLTKAVVRNPPAPFIGGAVFMQGPGNSRQSMGTLTASFPWEPNVPLAGADFGGHLFAFRAG